MRSGTERRRVVAFVIVSVIMLAVSGAIRISAPSPFAPRVHVRWAPGIGDAERGDLERQFALVEGRWRDGRTWEYDLVDVSPVLVQALIQASAVEDTHYIDRNPVRVADDAPPGRTRLAGRELAGWIHSSLFDWFTLLWVSSLFVSAVWLASVRDGEIR